MLELIVDVTCTEVLEVQFATELETFQLLWGLKNMPGSLFATIVAGGMNPVVSTGYDWPSAPSASMHINLLVRMLP
jgi:hypothetical protein